MLRPISFVTLIVLFVSSPVRAQFDATFNGGGGNDLWSNPLNWSPPGVPAAGSSLLILAPDGVTQDIVGVEVTRIAAGPLEVRGNPIRVRDGGVIEARFTSSRIVDFRNELILLGDVNVVTGQLADVTCMVLRNVNGPGSLNAGTSGFGTSAHITIVNASYAGDTRIGTGELRIGGNAGSVGGFQLGSTTGQGNYIVSGGARLGGSGTIGMQAGGKIVVESEGVISPSIGTLGSELGTINVNGDLQLLSGGVYSAEIAYVNANDRVKVNGTLDTSAAGDRLIVFSNYTGTVPGTYTIMTYANRLGEFDNVIFGGSVATASPQLIYTSAANSGPGQILVVVPEPVSAAFFAVALITLRRRRD